MNAVQEKIRKQFPDIAFPDAYVEPLKFGFGKERIAPGWAVITMKNKDEEAEVVYAGSDQYKLLHHEEMLNAVLEARKDFSKEYGEPVLKKPKLLHHGAVFQVDLHFPNYKPDTALALGRDFTPYISIKNAINGTSNALGWLKAFKKLCANGMFGMGKEFALSKRHTQGLSLNGIADKINKALENNSRVLEMYARWGKIFLKDTEQEDFIEKLPLPKKYKEEVLQIEEKSIKASLNSLMIAKKPITVYDFANATTQVLTHSTELSEERRSALDADVEKFFLSRYAKAA